MAMLVITRGYIKSPRNIWMWCAKSKTGHWPSPVGLRYIKPCKTWFNKNSYSLYDTRKNLLVEVGRNISKTWYYWFVYVIFFNGRSNGCWFVYKGTTYIPKEIKPWWNIVQIRNLLDFSGTVCCLHDAWFFFYPDPSECLTIMIHGEPRSNNPCNQPAIISSIYSICED